MQRGTGALPPTFSHTMPGTKRPRSEMASRAGRAALPVAEGVDVGDVAARMGAGEEVTAEEYMALVRCVPAFASCSAWQCSSA